MVESCGRGASNNENPSDRTKQTIFDIELKRRPRCNNWQSPDIYGFSSTRWRHFQLFVEATEIDIVEERPQQVRVKNRRLIFGALINEEMRFQLVFPFRLKVKDLRSLIESTIETFRKERRLQQHAKPIKYEMDQLIDPSQAGNIDGLYAVIEQNPHMLAQIDDIPFFDTSLHVTACAGHLQYATEITSDSNSREIERFLNEVGEKRATMLETSPNPQQTQDLDFIQPEAPAATNDWSNSELVEPQNLSQDDLDD
ncbi:unnamed protein product [Dovyalis caffra]|uniref:Uncharacterized protein n=1 Tax=Dovyalis caffra TaxID=77055 RepID=A0AAV1SRA8_9ROSI|nr:unnamed protein product [Dovyalis caffra]